MSASRIAYPRVFTGRKLANLGALELGREEQKVPDAGVVLVVTAPGIVVEEAGSTVPGVVEPGTVVLMSGTVVVTSGADVVVESKVVVVEGKAVVEVEVEVEVDVVSPGPDAVVEDVAIVVVVEPMLVDVEPVSKVVLGPAVVVGRVGPTSGSASDVTSIAFGKPAVSHAPASAFNALLARSAKYACRSVHVPGSVCAGTDMTKP